MLNNKSFSLFLKESSLNRDIFIEKMALNKVLDIHQINYVIEKSYKNFEEALDKHITFRNWASMLRKYRQERFEVDAPEPFLGLDGFQIFKAYKENAYDPYTLKMLSPDLFEEFQSLPALLIETFECAAGHIKGYISFLMNDDDDAESSNTEGSSDSSSESGEGKKNIFFIF